MVRKDRILTVVLAVVFLTVLIGGLLVLAGHFSKKSFFQTGKSLGEKVSMFGAPAKTSPPKKPDIQLDDSAINSHSPYISKKQAQHIESLIGELVRLEMEHSDKGRRVLFVEWYAKLKSKFGLASLDEIPKGLNNDIIYWIKQQRKQYE